jgi:hypothetical protein
MTNPQIIDELLPLAVQWAQSQEELILSRGAALTPQHNADAQRAGVQDCARVRVLVVERLPLPDNERLAAVARGRNIVTTATRGAGMGHGVIIRADCWGDRELLVHQFVHVAQSERLGSLERFVEQYLRERLTSASFTIGPLEEEARRLAREICAQ